MSIEIKLDTKVDFIRDPKHSCFGNWVVHLQVVGNGKMISGSHTFGPYESEREARRKILEKGDLLLDMISAELVIKLLKAKHVPRNYEGYVLH